MQKELTEIEISGTITQGLKVSGKNGISARLAVIDDDGNILAEGPNLAKAIWNLVLQTLQNFWIGKGHMRVFIPPPTAMSVTPDLRKAA